METHKRHSRRTVAFAIGNLDAGVMHTNECKAQPFEHNCGNIRARCTKTRQNERKTWRFEYTCGHTRACGSQLLFKYVALGPGAQNDAASPIQVSRGLKDSAATIQQESH